MRFVARILAVIPLAFGLALLALGIFRSRLPYENERYFDAQTQTVYHLQAAELYLIGGGAMTFVGLLIAYTCFRLTRTRRSSPQG